MELKFWIAASALVIVTSVLAFLLKTWFREILEKLDDLAREMKQATRSATVHDEQIKNLREQDRDMHLRLNDHALRIRKLEMSK